MWYLPWGVCLLPGITYLFENIFTIAINFHSCHFFRFLENEQHFPAMFWLGKKVLDIGAGTGVAGLAAGILG